jgi:hypothetical protein
MSIECIGFRSFQKGCMQGFASFFLPKMGLEIHGCSVWQKDGRRWVNLPSREYKDKETGETKYSSVIRFRDELYFKAFCDGAKKAIDEWCLKNSELPEQKPQEIEEQDLPF